jgi:peptidylprolyl isomerase
MPTIFNLVLFLQFAIAGETQKEKSMAPLTMANVMASAQDSDWRTPSPENVLYVELRGGRVIIELAPEFAPQHVANVKALAREKYWDGLKVVRVQDNYVVQWADPKAENPQKKKKIKAAKETLAPEFDQAILSEVFTALPDRDVYSPEVGFVNGFPAAKDIQSKKMWLAHCYGAVGAGRNNSIDSGGGSELYVVIGHAPRHLDRNVTLIGRVIQGMELLSSLKRGTGPLGFYEKPNEQVPLLKIRIAADVPEKQRTEFQVLRTDSETFKNLIKSRRHRKEEWFHEPTGKIDLCNVPIPVRRMEAKKIPTSK